MPLSPGEKLGPYEIVSPIGAGGMGEVYKARDTRLDRTVAVKVLPEHIAKREDSRARFEREARAVASLNHPNICTLHDIGPGYMVMEFIEGETLAARIEKGPLPVEQAIGFATQIADALDRAHRAGVTHRDVKPGNIMLTRDGAKVLDFGLAKSAVSDASTAVTQTALLTVEGTVMGTPQYMPPEQFEGKEADARADIWAFGAVLYEMVTGQKAFQGKTYSSLVGAILSADPPPMSVQPFTPAWLERLVRRCLQKDPEDRWQSMRDVVLELRTPPVAELVAATPARASRWPWIAAGVLLLAVLGVSLLHFQEAPPEAPLMRLSVPIPANTRPGYLALSPDGRLLAAVLVDGKQFRLSIRSLDEPAFQPLPGTDGSRGPFWSPDSKFVGFFADGKLKIVPAAGGPPQVLCDGAGSGSWNRDGVILFTTNDTKRPLQRVTATGGACTAVPAPEGNGTGFEFLPDGKHFVYRAFAADEAKAGLYVSSLDAEPGKSTPRRLLADSTDARFAPSNTGKKYGYLLFLRGNALLAQPFNAGTLELAGDAFRVASDANQEMGRRVSATASAAGTLVYASNTLPKGYQLTWLDRDGKETGKAGEVQSQRHVTLSFDGKWAATARQDDGIWLHDLQRGGETRLTKGASPGVWSPQGDRIVFSSGNKLYSKEPTGDPKQEPLLESENQKAPSDWSSDGRYLIYTETDSKGLSSIWYLFDPLNKTGERKSVPFQTAGEDASQGQLSPDGHWLAYVSQNAVWVRPFPYGPGRWKVSAGTQGCAQPRWRRDGKELFYLDGYIGKIQLMAVTVQPGPRGEFDARPPQALFEFLSRTTTTTRNYFLYSPSADGKRFLVNVQANDDAPPTLNLINNWEKAALSGK